MKILVCGGAGYIGSHTAVVLIQQGHDVRIMDNLSNSSPAVLERIGSISGRSVEFIQGDIRDHRAVAEALAGKVDVVIHFAALKSVADSCVRPLDYFDNNISGTISLLQGVAEAGIRHLVFSSSATVYGNAEAVPVTEESPLQVVNPYGRTKLVMEDLIRDFCVSRPEFSAVLLRYFNPVGAHPSGQIGESPIGTPSNLMPYVTQVACGRRPFLQVYGDDYPTRDGTGVRDYIHVMDLADAHASSVSFALENPGATAINIGTGRGHSVLELIRTFEEVCGVKVPYRVVGRRAGDVGALWADVSRSRDLLGWQSQFGLETMCTDAWRWQAMNPDGYPH